jgi:uncharacterized protein (TIGR02145 family)
MPTIPFLVIGLLIGFTSYRMAFGVKSKQEKAKKMAEEVAAVREKFTDPRDGKVYRTVKIGEQIWMAQNLNYEAEGSVCYGNDPANGEKYGRLYDWETAMKASPPGWHLPSDDEWQTLVDFAGGKEIAGKKLKTKSGWNNDKEGNSGNGTDDFGFAALPGGLGYSGGDRFSDSNKYGFWWSASESKVHYAYYRYLSFLNEHIGWYSIEKYSLFSVRCVQD